MTIKSKGVYSTQQTVDATFGAARKLMGDTKGPLLFDARIWPGGDYEVWVSVIKELGERFTAVVMLLGDSPAQAIEQFAKSIDRLVIPSRSFVDEADAMAFLSTYLPAAAAE